MHATLDPALALSLATARDLLRRPGFALGAVALLAILAPLPRLGSPAASPADNSALAVELSLATVGIVACLVAGACGVQAGCAADGQATPEILTTPCSTTALAGGRLVGITAAVAALASSVVGGTAVLWTVVGPFPEIRAPASVALSLLGTLLAALAFASFGLLLGTCASRWLAHVLVVGLLVFGRTIPATASWSMIDVVAAAAPTARMDVARDAAFGRAISIPAMLLGAGAVLCAAAAAALVAARRLERRERS